MLEHFKYVNRYTGELAEDLRTVIRIAADYIKLAFRYRDFELMRFALCWGRIDI